jgi:hypothetical protein
VLQAFQAFAHFPFILLLSHLESSPYAFSHFFLTLIHHVSLRPLQTPDFATSTSRRFILCWRRNMRPSFEVERLAEERFEANAARPTFWRVETEACKATIT